MGKPNKQKRTKGKSIVPQIPRKKEEPSTQAALSAEVAALVVSELQKLGLTKPEAGVNISININMAEMAAKAADKPKTFLGRVCKLFNLKSMTGPAFAALVLTTGGMFLNSTSPAEASFQDTHGRAAASMVMQEMAGGVVKARFGEVAGSITTKGAEMLNEAAAERAKAKAEAEARARREAAAKHAQLPGARAGG